jgi:hypothetical protein
LHFSGILGLLASSGKPSRSRKEGNGATARAKVGKRGGEKENMEIIVIIISSV